MIVINTIKKSILIQKYGSLHELSDQSSYHEFVTVDEAQKWGNEIYSEWATAHTKTYARISEFKDNTLLHAVDPVARYFGEEYKNINQFLRSKGSMCASEQIKIFISNLIVSICSAPVINRKLILYRQVPEEMIDEMIVKNKDSAPYQERGFMSTSFIKKICAENCGNSPYMLKMHIENLSPIHAIYANLICYRDEEELLLQPDLYIRMIEYPYKDAEIGKTIFPVQVFKI